MLAKSSSLTVNITGRSVAKAQQTKMWLVKYARLVLKSNASTGLRNTTGIVFSYFVPVEGLTIVVFLVSIFG
jgi:hypothetical protein